MEGLNLPIRDLDLSVPYSVPPMEQLKSIQPLPIAMDISNEEPISKNNKRIIDEFFYATAVDEQKAAFTNTEFNLPQPIEDESSLSSKLANSLKLRNETKIKEMSMRRPNDPLPLPHPPNLLENERPQAYVNWSDDYVPSESPQLENIIGAERVSDLVGIKSHSPNDVDDFSSGGEEEKSEEHIYESVSSPHPEEMKARVQTPFWNLLPVFSKLQSYHLTELSFYMSATHPETLGLISSNRSFLSVGDITVIIGLIRKYEDMHLMIFVEGLLKGKHSKSEEFQELHLKREMKNLSNCTETVLEFSQRSENYIKTMKEGSEKLALFLSLALFLFLVPIMGFRNRL